MAESRPAETGRGARTTCLEGAAVLSIVMITLAVCIPGYLGMKLTKGERVAIAMLEEIERALRVTDGAIDGNGSCPGGSSHGHPETAIPALGLDVHDAGFDYSIEVRDDDGDGVCEAFVLRAVDRSAQLDDFVLRSDGSREGPWTYHRLPCGCSYHGE